MDAPSPIPPPPPSAELVEVAIQRQLKNRAYQRQRYYANREAHLAYQKKRYASKKDAAVESV